MSRRELAEKIFLLACVPVIWPAVMGWNNWYFRVLQILVLVILAVMAVRKIMQWRRL